MDSGLMTNAILTFLAIFILFLLLNKTLISKGNRYLSIGPPSLPILGSLPFLIWPGTEKLKVVLKWAQDYGPIYKATLLHQKLVYVNDPPAIQTILSSSNPHYLSKNRLIYKNIFVEPLTDGLASSYVHIWAPHRKIIAKAFTFKSQKHHLDIINRESGEMVECLMKAEHIIKESTDGQRAWKYFNEILHYSTIKAILHVVVGPENCTEQVILAIQRDMEAAKEIVMYRLDHPWLLFKPIWWFHPMRQRLDQCSDFYGALIHSIIGKQSGKEDDKSSILNMMLEGGLSEKEIVNELVTVAVGGHETVCLAQNFLLLFLALNEKHEGQCREEVDAVFGNGDSYTLGLDDLCGLKHLERCVYETLRLYPVVPMFLRQIGEPMKLDANVRVDAGSTVVICPWTLHRNPEYYPNPEVFDPDRFLPENCKARHAYAYIPFSAGPRNCIGYKFGIMEMKVITAHLLRHFEIFTGHEKVEDVGVDFKAGTLHAHAGFKLFFKRRVETIS